ncbi:VWA domain-containing protein [uncultured Paludibaculum sp.]|uniref:VWA domain-containing protein n=1 Tax=uncultured Paludibaculum sp. TaxID=1765020 RepID=UPI002AABEC12|nr:VWA domain-containing protein [uncultured Paludibaculum sp.]
MTAHEMAAVGPGGVPGPKACTWTWFLGGSGTAMIVAVAFPADAVGGFPPGTPEGPPTSITTRAFTRFIAGALGFTFLVISCFLFAVTAAAQNAPQFRTEVSLVRVDAEVTDGTRTLTGLAQADFEVFDNGDRQEITHFSEAEEPLDLILLFDVSGSMNQLLGKIAATARRALAEFRPGDRVAVMAFSTKSRYIVDFTEDFDFVERAVYDHVLGDVGAALREGERGTAIMAALDDAVDRFPSPRATHRRRAVLIITDNLGFRTRREQRVLHKYWEADVVLTGVLLTNLRLEINRQYTRFAPHWWLIMQGMTGIAEKTGGDVLKGSDPAEAFGESVRRLRRRYSLFYRAPVAVPGKPRQVKVDLTRTARQRLVGARVRARKGYVTPAAQNH